MKHESISDFAKRVKKSRSTIYRFYKTNNELFLETKMNEKRMVPIDHVKYFSSEALFEENKFLSQENKSMRNLINNLMDKDSLVRKLWYMDWSYFFTVAYSAERNKKSCFRQMSALYEHLEKEYGVDTDIRLFFTTEPFNNRTGYHNHFMIYIEKEYLRQIIVKEIHNFFNYDRVDFTVYDKFKPGLFYITKDGLVEEDWDILGNNLKVKPGTDG